MALQDAALAVQIPEVKPINPLEVAGQALGIQRAKQQIASDRLIQQERVKASTARDALQKLLAVKPDASAQDMLQVGGQEAIPLIKEHLSNQAMQIKNADDTIAQHAKFNEAIGQGLVGLKDIPVEQRLPYQQKLLQQWSASFPTMVTPDMVQQYAQQPETDEDIQRLIGLGPARKQALEEAANQAKQLREKNESEQKILTSKAEAGKFGAETAKATAETARIGQVPGVDVPFPATVLAQKIAEKQAAPAPQPQAPMSPERLKQELQLKEAGQSAVSLTPEGLDVAATAFAKTGQLPPMGMGKEGAAVRSKIINRAAEINPSLDIAGNKASYEANKSSLTGLQKNRDAVVSFENTANKNLDLLLSRADKIIDTGSPWINKPLRTIATGAVGNENVPAFNAARQVAVNEIAKITSNPGLSGQLSDTARREVESFIPENATFKQIVSVAKILKQDMKNRHDSLDEQIKAISDRIGGGNSPSGGKKITETLINANLRANRTATRQQVIDALKGAGYQE